MRRVFALVFLPLAITATLATTTMTRAGFCCDFEYLITNRTSKGAEVTLSRRSITKSGQRVYYRVWVPAGERKYLTLSEDRVYYDLEANFKANGEGSKTIATATQWWWLSKGSADKLVEEGGHFTWAPGR